MRRFADVPTVEFDDLREDLEWVLRRLTAAELRDVIAVNLTREDTASQ